MINARRTLIALVLSGISFGGLLSDRLSESREPKPVFAAEAHCQPGKPIDSTGQLPVYRRIDIHPAGLTRQTHASALLDIGNGELLAAWYGGSYEGSKDSAIYLARFSPEQNTWSEARAISNRFRTGESVSRYVKKVGNPVLVADKAGTIHLFYVSVSLGGWSGSSINHIRSTDRGETWSTARRLISSPFFNLSTLVKGQPMLLESGVIALPVYHELAGKFGEMLYIDTNKGVIDKRRISHGRASLQPSVVAFSDKDAVALLRYAGKAEPRIQYSRTSDGGLNWSAMAATGLPNPNAAVSALCLGDSSVLLVFNNNEHGRNDLSLAASDDRGMSWKVLHQVEYERNDQTEHRFSYPHLVRDSRGMYHISYTWNKTVIKHVSFNQAWLESKLK